jgi:D-amino-acid dehydrogenase
VSASDRVVVLGAGVIGAACAHYCLELGRPVTIVDQGPFGKGCSHGNCGLICPSHVLPLAGPGAARRALAAMMRRDAPFSIRPRLDRELWRWLVAFRKRCNRRDMLAAGRAINSLLQSSKTLYDELFASGVLEAEYEKRGLLYVLHTQKGMEHFAAAERLTREEFGVSAQRLEGDEVSRFEPALKEGLAGGWHYSCDAHLRPDKLMQSWRRSLESREAAVRENCSFVGFERTGRRVAAALLSDGRVEAGVFVVACGAWTSRRNAELGCRLPIQPGKGYSLTMPRPAQCPSVPLLFDEHRVAVTPMQSGYRLGSIMEFAGYDESLAAGKLEMLRRGASHYLREPLGQGEQEPWYGWRPMTPDSLPIIGRAPALENVFVAAGHNMLGVSMAPATGKLIAELIGARPPHLDPSPYATTRF